MNLETEYRILQIKNEQRPGPGTANTFRKMLDLSEVKWNGIQLPQTRETLSNNTKQTSLSDFLK